MIKKNSAPASSLFAYDLRGRSRVLKLTDCAPSQTFRRECFNLYSLNLNQDGLSLFNIKLGQNTLGDLWSEPRLLLFSSISLGMLKVEAAVARTRRLMKQLFVQVDILGKGQFFRKGESLFRTAAKCHSSRRCFRVNLFICVVRSNVF